MYKVVMMPIEVPKGDYCWDGHSVCRYFDNEGGGVSCNLGFHYLKYDSELKVLKPEKCNKLVP